MAPTVLCAMTPTGGLAIDAELMTFIGVVVDSVELVDVLQLLVAAPHGLEAETIARLLAANTQSIEHRLRRLEAHGLVVSRGSGCHYEPSSPSVDRLVKMLLHEYRTRRHRIIEAIFGGQ
jgi:hypothetical protein